MLLHNNASICSNQGILQQLRIGRRGDFCRWLDVGHVDDFRCFVVVEIGGHAGNDLAETFGVAIDGGGGGQFAAVFLDGPLQTSISGFSVGQWSQLFGHQLQEPPDEIVNGFELDQICRFTGSGA